MKKNESLVNKEVLKRNMKYLDSGKTVKLISLRQDEAGFQGHSMLVKKIRANNFIFFDPDWGEKRDLTLDDLSLELNILLKNCDDICFIDGEKFLKAFHEMYPKVAV